MGRVLGSLGERTLKVDCIRTSFVEGREGMTQTRGIRLFSFWISLFKLLYTKCLLLDISFLNDGHHFG